MKKYYFFVDYENVNVDGMNGLDKLTENCTVIIFYTDAAQTLTFGLHRRINLSKADIKFKKVKCGTKNALDFQLCSQLGFTISENKYAFPNDVCYYFIVSKDNGFVVLEDYFNCQKAPVKVINDLTSAIFKKLMESEKIDNENVTNTEILTSDNNTNDKPESVISVILKNAPNNSVFAQELYCLFKAKKGKEEIEKCIQKYITDGEDVKKMIEELRPFMK